MKVVDANVLIYAVAEDSAHHAVSHRWLTGALSGGETVAIPWVSLLAFLRITTHARVFPRPLTVDQATSVVSSWLSAPTCVVPEPGPRHFSILAGLLREAGTAANLTNDAHLAALALELGAEVASFDRDFERFGVSVFLPA